MSSWGLLRVWLQRAAPGRRELVRAFVLASIASLAGAALFIGAIALLVVSAHRPGLRAIGVFLIGIELVAFLRSPLRYAERMSSHRLGFVAVAQWRRWLMEMVGSWSFTRWLGYSSGDLLERSLHDTEELQDLWLRGVIPCLSAMVTLLSADVVVVCLTPFPKWWVVVLALLGIQVVSALALFRRLEAHVAADRNVRARRGHFLATLVASQATAPEVELLGCSDFLRDRNSRAGRDLSEAEKIHARVRRSDAFLVVTGPLATLVVVGSLHPRSAPVWLIVTSVIAFVTFDSLNVLRSSVQTAVAVIGGAERLDEMRSSSEASQPWPADGSLLIDNVTVETHTGIRRLRATIVPGARVAVGGPSGVGKSTFLRALARLDDPAGGQVIVGGTPLSDIAEDQLRRHVTMVPSEPGLLHGYVRDVLGLDRPVGDDDLAALERIGIHVGRNDFWHDLSRGERQRVAIVRALMRRPDILLLDEPTSALGDTETHALLELLSSFRGTIIVATHDPLVLAWSDELIDLSVRASL